MKTIKQQNMDLDLRRFGHNLYTEALNSGSGEGFDLNAAINECLVQEAPPSQQSSIVLPDLWCYDEKDSFKKLNIEAVIEAVIKGNYISIIPFYKESPQKDSNNVYLISEEPGVGSVPAAQIERIVSDVINGETYYSLATGLIGLI